MSESQDAGVDPRNVWSGYFVPEFRRRFRRVDGLRWVTISIAFAAYLLVGRALVAQALGQLLVEAVDGKVVVTHLIAAFAIAGLLIASIRASEPRVLTGAFRAFALIALVVAFTTYTREAPLSAVSLYRGLVVITGTALSAAWLIFTIKHR